MADRKAETNAISGQPQKAIMDFDPPKKPKRNKYAFACALLASMTSVLLGYDIGVMSGAMIYIQDDLKISDAQIEILAGILNLYSLIGSCAAGRTSDWIGRRYTIVYTAEVSPASTRGFLTSFPEVFINAGILLGYVSNYAFSKLPTHYGWRVMLGVGAVPSVILAIVVLWMPESPRWLVMQGRLGDAKTVLGKTSDSKEEAQIRLADIKEAAGIPEDCTDDIVQVSKRSHGEDVWKELLLRPTPAVRHVLIAAVGIHFFQQCSGIDSVVLYSPRIFKKAGLKSNNQLLLATVAVGFVKTVFILVATFMLDKVGRRPLLLSSVAGMVFSLATLGFGLKVIDHSDHRVTWAVALSIMMVMSFVAFFSIGMGPITWVYSSEIFPLKLRAQGTSLGVATNRLTSGVISMTFISLYDGITIGGTFFLYAGFALVSWVFFYFMLPETQGRTLEDMEGLFGNFKWNFPKNRNNNNIREVSNGGGNDLGVMSGAMLYIKDDLKISDVQIEILAGILNLYSLIGSFAAGRTSDWIGRRYTIVVSQAIFFVGAILMGFSTNYAFLMVGRFFAGVGVGYALMIAPVYTAEVSPASTRGFLTSFPEVFINSGILLGYVSNYAFSKLPTHYGWRAMLGVGAVPSVILGIVVLWMPESPRWLVMQGRLGDAKTVLDKTSDSKEEAQIRLADIKEAAGIPENCTDDIVQVSKRSHGEDVWKELLLRPTPAVRHVLVAAVGIHFFQQCSGIDSVVLYSPRIFEKAGIKSASTKLLATVAVGFVKTVSILIATFLLDKIGRRPLLLSSVAGMIISLATLASGLTVINHNVHTVSWAVALCIIMLLAFVASFSIGMGPITWVYSSEIFPLKLRAQGASLGVAVNRLTSGVISMTFISLYKGITIGGAFFLYAGVALVSWVFFYFMLPETQGRTLEDMERLFGNFKWKLAKNRNNNIKEVSNGGGNDNGPNRQVQLGTK
ncbi:polyol transporter 5 [Quercus suber]|uniref:Polyol transporter 5 n=1 Tax=Quercus suber TaxID=58331 RepID=A0AAW0LCY4_QUESU